MRLIDANSELQSLGLPVVTTNDAAACLKLSPRHASKILSRLAEAKRVVKLVRGRWLLSTKVDPLILPENLTAPWPSYISLQSALFYYGMTSQIPSVVYAVSLHRTRRFQTPIAEISIHHISAEFFFGFESLGRSCIKMATPEKALVDTLYLGASPKAAWFKSLPEIEFPRKFKFATVTAIIKRIASKRHQALVLEAFEQIRGRACR